MKTHPIFLNGIMIHAILTKKFADGDIQTVAGLGFNQFENNI